MTRGHNKTSMSAIISTHSALRAESNSSVIDNVIKQFIDTVLVTELKRSSLAVFDKSSAGHV